MIWALVVLGLILIAIFVFVLFAALLAEKWYLFHTKGIKREKRAKKERKGGPSVGWYVITALAAFIGISVLCFVPFLMPVLAFVMLLQMNKIRDGEKHGVARFTIWTVIIGSGILIALSLSVLVVGLLKSMPSKKGPMIIPLEKIAKGQTPTELSKLIEFVCENGTIVTDGEIRL